MYYGVAALDPSTGKELWRYDSKAYEDGQPPNGTGFVHRGVVAWKDGDHLRIFLNARYKLIQLDAKTGTPVSTFGSNGIVDLSEGLVWAINKKHYTNTSPPVIYKNLIIVGNGVGDRLTYKNDPLPARLIRARAASMCPHHSATRRPATTWTAARGSSPGTPTCGRR
jgi:quinoprotein glucose dehydrogenase